MERKTPMKTVHAMKEKASTSDSKVPIAIHTIERTVCKTKNL